MSRSETRKCIALRTIYRKIPIQNKRRGEPRRPSCHCYADYLQAGAPSEVAMPSGSAASLTKIAHVTFAVPVRLLFVIDASQPPPAALDRTSTLLNASHERTSYAACFQTTTPTLLVTLVLY